MKNKKLKNHYIDRYYKYHYSKDGGSWEVKKLKNDCLYYSGLNRNYATKIKKEDLPENFMNFWDGISWNFLNSAGVVDILYQPVINNHVFRDDSLYISYTDKIKYKKKYEDIDECFNWFEVENAEQYERIWGGEIIEFLLFAEKYSGYNIEPIKEQMWQKMLLLQKYEPETFNEYVKNRKVFDDWFNLERFYFKNK